MIGQIRVLTPEVVNKIAAGEVVERPASVVKELVENSLDAGSIRITVEIKGGGKDLIRVIDDGCGMDKKNALLSLQRHSTSKIVKADDLGSILSFGFRGEALPAIGAVSRLELVTRREENLEGTRVYAEGGVVSEVRKEGCPPGTMITVRNLFFNTPARKKFLKTVVTESNHISSWLGDVSLTRGDVFFQLKSNGAEVFTLPQVNDLRERIAVLYGRNLTRDLLPLEFSDGSLELGGFISQPAASRSRPLRQFFYVNGRPVRSRLVNHALMDGYRMLLPPGKFPVVFLFLKINPALVDVNVHPAKREVKFSQEGEVHDFIVRAVQETLKKKKLIPEITIREDRKVRIKKRVAQYLDKESSRLSSPELFDTTATTTTKKPITSFAVPHTKDMVCKEQLPQDKNDEDSLIFTPLVQFENSYILSCQEGKLIIFDQHAAHERILYQRLRQRIEKPEIKAESQTLLFPVNLEFSLKEAKILKDNLQDILSLGFDIEEFGGNAFLLRAVPSFLDKVNPEQLLFEVVDDLSAVQKIKSPQERKNQIIMIMACRGAVKAGDKLEPEEIGYLLRELPRTENFYTCPHGRPTMLELTCEELEKRFKRK